MDDVSPAEELTAMLRCPACSSQGWDLRAAPLDDLARLEGTLCCGTCGQAFDVRGGVLDMVPEVVEGRLAALRRRVISPTAARLYEETLRNVPTPLASPITVTDREAWLRRHTPGNGVARVLDLGCGRGHELTIMRETSGARLSVGIDLSRVLLAEAAARARQAGVRDVAFVRADVASLPLAPAAVSWASCFGVLHRLTDPQDALRAIGRIVEPGGTFTALAALQLPRGALRSGQALVEPLLRVRFFDRDRLGEMCAEAGLEVMATAVYGPVGLLAARRPTSRP